VNRTNVACRRRRHDDAGEAPFQAHWTPRQHRVARVPEKGRLFRHGDYWAIAFDGRTTFLRAAKGFDYLAHLLGNPTREVHVLDLVALERPRADGPDGPRRGLGTRCDTDAGPVLDEDARTAYRQRIVDLEDEVNEARAFGDTARIERATDEREQLVRELARAFGISGRARRSGSASERARASVTLAIRRAVKRINAEHPSLGEHLEATIRTGTYCSYFPDPRAGIVWDTAPPAR
jgi:hypothetical protein